VATFLTTQDTFPASMLWIATAAHGQPLLRPSYQRHCGIGLLAGRA